MHSFSKTGFLIFLLAIAFSKISAQQKTDSADVPCILFPAPMLIDNWKFSIGLLNTTTPEDITEEMSLRIPSVDFQALKKLNNHFNINSRVLFQFLQNHVSFGLRWTKPLTNKLFFSAGDDFAYWFGKLKEDEFNTKGYGFLNYPNFSFGYKTSNNLLLTFKTEAILNLYDRYTIGKNVISNTNYLFSGSAYTLGIEQAFYNQRFLTLAFTAMYTNFFWQTWPLFETFDRNHFYPQITVGFIL